MTMLLEDHGQVKQLALPPHWQESENYRQAPLTHGPETRTFTPDNDPEVRLCFHFRGFALGKESADCFRRLLAQAPHTLTAEELESVEMVIREASEPENFDLRILRTEMLQGKVILVLEGYWKELGRWDLGIYLDAAGNGYTVQELHYIAPPGSYEKYKPEILAHLSNIVWR